MRTENRKPGERFLRPQDLRRLENFEIAAKQIVDGYYAGKHRSPRYDASAEFAAYRPYVPGDEIRALDWKASARTDRDYIKLFRRESDRRCVVLLDSSASMNFRDEAQTLRPASKRFWNGRRKEAAQAASGAASNEPGLTKFEYGAYLSAALCYLTLRQGDKAGLALGAETLETFLPAGGSAASLRRVLLTLEKAKPTGRTNLSAALRALFGATTGGRGLLIVVSDFLEPAEPLFDALARFAHRGWKILLFHVLTETESDLPENDGPVRYRDAESSAWADAEPDALRPAYRAALQAWFSEMETQAKARGIGYARFSTVTPYDQALERFLAGK